jgi:pyridoxamine 5'-phosphate oxidase
MIKFNNLSQEHPYLLFKRIYIESLKAKQQNIEAICISSYSLKNKDVNARFVNLKFVNEKEFIFFSNYNSPKSKDFEFHDQITGLLYWNSTNTQIRMKARIKKTSLDFNQEYFAKRSKKKNALAISSSQSNIVSSYNVVKENYEKSIEEDDLMKCPDYWGGFSFTPYYFEFWKGHETRLNRREVYSLNNSEWIKSYLQP